MASIDDFADQLAGLPDLSDDDLNQLESDLIDAFDEADQAGDTDNITALADALDQVRTEIDGRSGGDTGDAAAPAEAAPVAAAPEVAVASGEPDSGPDPVTVTTTVPTPEAAPASPDPDPEVEPQSEPEPDDGDGGDADTGEAPADPAAPPSQAQKGQTVAASSNTVAVPRNREPVVAAAPTSTVYVGADVPGFSAGQVLQSGEEFGRAMSARINMLARTTGGDGEQVLVASIRTEAPEERTLDFRDDPAAVWEKISAITDPDAITAAGGCCAPMTTRYDLFDCGGSSDRPVRDALASFRADRGGIRYFAAPALADINGGVGFWTCADDAAIDPGDEPGTGTNVPANWKQCARIQCPPEQTAEVQAVTLCLTFGVLQSRVFPELAVANNKLAMVAHARIAEAALLAQIKNGSTLITDGGSTWGAVRDLLTAVGRAAMYYRDRYRINSVSLRAIFPSWVLEALRADVVVGPDYSSNPRDHYGISDADIAGFFTDRKINVTWALDSSNPAVHGGGFFPTIAWTPGTPAGDGGVPPAVPAVPGQLPAWPTTVEWALFVEGAWLFLDGGSLDLGIIRDSSLVRANDYQQFSETFESAVNVGCESLWITSTIDVSGAYACCK